MTESSHHQTTEAPWGLGPADAGGTRGCLFGDVDTSPLYAFREAFHVSGADVNRDAVFGVLSLTFWALVAVTIKDLILVMRADNGGEGGILALTALIMQKTSASKGRLVLHPDDHVEAGPRIGGGQDRKEQTAGRIVHPVDRQEQTPTSLGDRHLLVG